jgi:cytochrome P450
VSDKAPASCPHHHAATATNGRLDLLSPAVVADPYPAYAELRERAPVVEVPENDLWLVTTHAACLEVLGDPERFSSRESLSGQNRFRDNPEATEVLRAGAGYPRVPTLILTDPPAHSRYRQVVQRALSPAKTVRRLTPQIEAMVDELIDGFAARGSCEFIGEFAYPLPMGVIRTVLGLPPEMLDTMKRWSDDFIAAQAGNIDSDRVAQAAVSTVEWEHYISDQLDARAADPSVEEREDFLSRLVVEGRGDEETPPLSRQEQLSLAQQLLVGGNETTTNLLGNLMVKLACDRAESDRLRDRPDLIPAFVEEVLRYESPLQGLYRVVVHDTEVEGVKLPAGARLMVLFASANRDEDIYGPDAFIGDRDMRADPHLAFGRGVHACMGQNIARREARIAVEKLLARLDDIRPSRDHRREPVELFGFHGLRAFHISFSQSVTKSEPGGTL